MTNIPTSRRGCGGRRTPDYRRLVAADRIADERLALGIAVPITLLGRADEVIE